MFHKLAILTLMLVFLAAALLILRQERLEAANRNAALYWQIQRSRQSIWATQARSAALLRPNELRERIEHAKLNLQPLDPAKAADPSRGWARGTSRAGEDPLR